MSRICVALLLFILVDCLYCRTASNVKFHVSKVDIHKCKCRGEFRVRPTGIIMCSKMELRKCLCSKENRDKFPKLKAACRSFHSSLSAPL